MDHLLTFPGLSQESFLHSTDRRALSAVKKLKGLDIIINAMNKVSYEKLFRLQSMGDDIRVTKKTCRSIYDKVEVCAKVLNMPVPDVFINQSGKLNAMTTGTASPMIQLYSGVIDFLSDEELLAAIAHEMGHIKCGHVLYRMSASFLQSGTSMLGPLKVLTDGAIAMTLLEWERKSELSADRAALLVTQDVKPVINLLMKIAGGSRKLADQVDYDDFLEQSRQYREMAKGVSGGTYKLFLNILRSHPFPVMRAAEIEEWSRTEEYKGILACGVPIKDHDSNYNSIPMKIDAVSGKKRSIPLMWRIPDLGNISGYNVFRSENIYGGTEENDDFQLIKSVNGRENNCFTDIGLEDGKTYFYYVKSMDLYNQESQATQIVSAQTKEIPKSIKTIEVFDNMVKEVGISWEVGYDLPESAKIILYRSEDHDSNFKKIQTLNSTETHFLDHKLKDGVTYSYCMRIEEDGLLSQASTIVSARTKPLPEPPAQFSATYNGERIYFRWEPVKEAASYSIYLKQMIADKNIFTTSQISHSIRTAVKPGKNYVYYIKSVDEYSRESEASKYFTLSISENPNANPNVIAL